MPKMKGRELFGREEIETFSIESIPLATAEHPSRRGQSDQGQFDAVNVAASVIQNPWPFWLF